MKTMGATTPTGKVLYDPQGHPIKETAREAAAQAIGFRPERVAARPRLAGASSTSNRPLPKEETISMPASA